MQLFDGDKLISMYKNRAIVEGGTAKIRKIFLQSIQRNETNLEVLIMGSPDHYTNPDFEDFELIVKAFNEGEEVEEKKTFFEIITQENVLGDIFKIESEEFDRVCVSIEKNNTKYDEDCFNIDLEGAREEYEIKNPKMTSLDWQYNEEKQELKISLIKEEEINGELKLIKNGETIEREKIEEGKERNIIFNVLPGQYILFFDDFDAKKQIVENLFLGEKGMERVSSNDINDISCGATICEENFVCDGDSFQSKEGLCCLGSCIPATQATQDLGILVPMIFWIAILFIITSIIIFRNSITRRIKDE
jgi:hypothetical protein